MRKDERDTLIELARYEVSKFLPSAPMGHLISGVPQTILLAGILLALLEPETVK